MEIEKNKNSKKKNENVRWFITVFIITFLSSLFFSYVSTHAINDLSIIPALLILFLVIFIGIIFDIVAVAVTVGEEHEFHAKATKKLPGAKTSIKLIRNSAKVANIGSDVIGDICGVLSGAISALITLKITNEFNVSDNLQFILSALVAAITVGGKAIGKVIAQAKSTEIVNMVGKILTFFSKKRK